MKTHFGLVLLFSLLSIANAFTPRTPCLGALKDDAENGGDGAIAHAHPQAQLFNKGLESKLFAAQKEGPYLSLGLLVELANGEKVLVATEYLGSSHEKAYKELSEIALKNGLPADQPIRRVLWGGEIEYTPKQQGGYTIQRANHTSGFVQKLLKKERVHGILMPNEVKNDAQELQTFLKDSGADIAPTFHVKEFHPDNMHLIDVKVPAEDSLLHQFDGVVNNLSGPLYLMGKEDPTVSITEYILDASEGLSRISPVFEQMKKIYIHNNDFPFFQKDLILADQMFRDLQEAHLTLNSKKEIPQELDQRLRENSRLIGRVLQNISRAGKIVEAVQDPETGERPIRSNFVSLSNTRSNP